MKITFKRLAASCFLGLIVTNVAMADDGPKCPPLIGSTIRSAYTSGTVFYELAKSPFEGGMIYTEADNVKDATTLANAAFLTTKASGNARKITDSKDGSYFFVCDSLYGNYTIESGISRAGVNLFTPKYKATTSLSNKQNFLAPHQPTVQEKYELVKLEQIKNLKNPFN